VDEVKRLVEIIEEIAGGHDSDDIMALTPTKSRSLCEPSPRR